MTGLRLLCSDRVGQYRLHLGLFQCLAVSSPSHPGHNACSTTFRNLNWWVEQFFDRASCPISDWGTHFSGLFAFFEGVMWSRSLSLMGNGLVTRNLATKFELLKELGILFSLFTFWDSWILKHMVGAVTAWGLRRQSSWEVMK